jgi:hypothetical protein
MLDEGLEGGIPVKFLPAAIVEGNFYDLAGAFRIVKGQIGKPVVNIEPVASSAAAPAVALASGRRSIFISSTRATAHKVYMLIYEETPLYGVDSRNYD